MHTMPEIDELLFPVTAETVDLGDPPGVRHLVRFEALVAGNALQVSMGGPANRPGIHIQ